MADFVLGMNAKLYYSATAGTVLGSLTELSNVKDLTLNLTAGEADITTRGNSGWRATAQTLKEAELTFQMVWKPGDAAFEAIRDAFLNNTTVELAVLDQARGTSGAQGPKASWSITNFTRTENLEEAIVADVTAKISSFDEWVEVA
jgi:hypothetical protein